MFFKRFKSISVLAIISLVMALVLAACSSEELEGRDAVFAGDEHEGDLAVYFLDLKSDEKTGESIIVQTPEGQTILIDAGIPDSGPDVDAYLDELEIDKVDYVMPSHPHWDHIGGLQTIFKTKDIGKVIETNVPHDTGPYKEYKRLMEEEEIDVEIGEAGDVLELEDDLTLEIIAPPKGTSEDTLPEGYTGMKAGVINNVSMVMKLTYKEKSFLFTGDIYLSKEMDLVEEYGDELKSDVLVAPHHGHKTSSSNVFIEAVDPEIAMITANIMFNKRVYDRYVSYGADTYHSSIDGNVVLVSDGETIEIIPEKNPEDDENDNSNNNKNDN